MQCNWFKSWGVLVLWDCSQSLGCTHRLIIVKLLMVGGCSHRKPNHADLCTCFTWHTMSSPNFAHIQCMCIHTYFQDQGNSWVTQKHHWAAHSTQFAIAGLLIYLSQKKGTMIYGDENIVVTYPFRLFNCCLLAFVTTHVSKLWWRYVSSCWLP